MGLSPTHILILAVLAALLFGGGRFSTIMTDVAKGLKGFKKSMAEEDALAPRLDSAASAALAAESARHPAAADYPPA